MDRAKLALRQAEDDAMIREVTVGLGVVAGIAVLEAALTRAWRSAARRCWLPSTCPG
jgi:hypothetical protein